MAATKATMTTETSPAKVRLTDGLGHNAQNAERWYCVSRDGLATLCKDAADAHETAGQCDKSWPAGGPHRAVLLVDAAEIARLRHALAQSGKLAADRLQQINADRAQALLWKSLLRECQAHLACNAVNDDLVALYGRVRAALGEA